MSLEEALKQLEICAKQLESVGDVKTFIQDNKKEFLHRYAKVSQYYHYIEKNSKVGDSVFTEAINIVDDITKNNPSLKEFIELMISREYKKDVVPVQEETITKNNKVTELTNQIETLINELNKYDLDKLDDMEWALNAKKQELIELKDEFSVDEYERLLTAIDLKLENIRIINQQTQSLNSSYNL